MATKAAPHRRLLLPIVACLFILALSAPIALAQNETIDSDNLLALVQSDNETILADATTTDTPNATELVPNVTEPTAAPSGAPSGSPSMAPTWFGNVSPECDSETALLAQNGNLTDSLKALLTTYRDQFKANCPFTITDSGCDVTFGEPDTKTDYQTLCEALGGQVFQHTIILRCGVFPLNADYDLGLVPECIGLSCNVSTVDMEVLGSGNISEFGSSLDNGGCQGQVESAADTTTTTARYWGTTMVLSLVATMLF